MPKNGNRPLAGAATSVGIDAAEPNVLAYSPQGTVLPAGLIQALRYGSARVLVRVIPDSTYPDLWANPLARRAGCRTSSISPEPRTPRP